MRLNVFSYSNSPSVPGQLFAPYQDTTNLVQDQNKLVVGSKENKTSHSYPLLCSNLIIMRDTSYKIDEPFYGWMK